MKKMILTFALFTFIITNINGQWVQTGGPVGGYADDIVNIGSILFVSMGNGGVYKSIDNGDSWEWSSSGFPCNEGVQALLEHNGLLYASISRSGIYISNDQGESWEPINNGVENSTFYSFIVNGDEIYAGYSNGGIYYSPNNGASWENKSNGISTVYFQDFVIYNSKVYAGGSSLYETSDAGDNWIEVVIPGLGVNGIRSMTIKDDVFYVAGLGVVYVSTDNLTSWNTYFMDNMASIVSMNSYGDSVYLTTSLGTYYYTNDNGINWIKIENTNTSSFAHNVFFSDTKIMMSTVEGIYESFDMGVTWSINNTGLKAVQITALNSSANFLYSGTDNQGMFRSANNGQNWVMINSGLNGNNSHSISDILLIGDDVYIATGDGVYQSFNTGDNWEQKFYPGLNMSANKIAYADGVFATAVSASGIYISTDNAETWTQAQNIGLDLDTSYESLIFSDNMMVVSTANSEVYISEDNGDSWLNISIPGRYVRDLQYGNNILYASTSFGLYFSQDFGVTWLPFNNDPKHILDITIDDNVIYAATTTGIYATVEGKDEWFTLCEGIGQQYVPKILLKDNTLYAGTFSSSVWERSKADAELILEQSCEVQNITLCESSGTLNLLTILGANRPDDGVWNPGLSSGLNMFDPSIDLSGTYEYTYSPGTNFCDCEMSVKVEVLITETLSAGDDSSVSFCINSGVVDLFENLQGIPDPGGLWTPNLVSGSGVFNPLLDVPGIYTYTIENGDCISDSAEVVVTIDLEPNAGQNGNLSICSNDSNVNLMDSLGGTPDTGGVWSPSLVSGSNSFNPLIDASGVYTYSIGNGDCEASSEVFVTIYAEPNAGSNSDISICYNNPPVDLYDSLGGDPDIGGVWSPNLTSGTGVFDPLRDVSGIYTYTVQNGICAVNSSTVVVSLLDVTEISSYNINTSSFSDNNSIEIIVNSHLDYEYSIDGINYQESNIFNDLSGGDYTIYVREINGCGRLEALVSIVDFPKFFTPNNDGYNDTWKLKGTLNQSYKIYIHDRYGKLLKELSSIGNGWDGTFNGRPLPATDYWFKIEFSDGNFKTGNFSLKR